MSDWLGALIGAAERIGTRLATHKRPKRNPIQQIVLQAKQAGIHPLVAIQGGFSGQPLYGADPALWSTDTGFGEAVGRFGDDLIDQRRSEYSEGEYDRRRAEDFAHDRSMQAERSKPTAQDRYFEQLIKQSQAETKRIEAEMALKGATTGFNSSSFDNDPQMHPNQVYDPLTKRWYPKGRTIYREPFTGYVAPPGKGSDAQVVEDRESELGGMWQGIMNWIEKQGNMAKQLGDEWGLPDFW